MTDLKPLKDKTAIVTGASRGIGMAIAEGFAKAGASVSIAARNKRDLSSVETHIKKFNPNVIAFQTDVSQSEDVDALINNTLKSFGQIDILVNNAGISDPKKFKELTEESWLNIIETNLNGAYRVAKEIADLMLKQGDGGSIINIASILGIRVGLNLTSYAAAKAALIQLTKSMALELARSNIRVNAIAPGYIRTDLNKDFFKTKKGKEYIQSIPMNRLGLEKELDGPLLLLASNASSFITGSTIVVDGGHLVNPL